MRLPRPIRLPTLSAVATAAACHGIVGPDATLPPDAERMTPPDSYAAWYRQTEECTGQTGDFDRVRWFSVPHDRWWDPLWEQYAIGTWRAPHDIYVSIDHLDDHQVIKHEIVHDLLQGGRTFDPRFELCSGISHAR
jgi:hypothetical protein